MADAERRSDGERRIGAAEVTFMAVSWALGRDAITGSARAVDRFFDPAGARHTP
jgi:hypothetical protein